MIIAQVKMKVYGKVFIDTEELIKKYEKTDEDSRASVLEVISENVGEARNVVNISDEIRKLFEKQDEQFIYKIY